MARVQMLHHITGGRGDGVWPPAGGILECGEQEARDLVAGLNAVWIPGEPETPAEPPAAEPADDETAEPENGAESDGRPRVRDPKEAWETYAMTVHGLDVNSARSMTKADLIATYGGQA